MTVVKVSWKAFGDLPQKNRFMTDAVIETTLFDNAANDFEILNKVYQDTNLYNGSFWNQLEKVMPLNRTHTALSVGDEVAVNEVVYRCGSFGWDKVK